MMLIFLGGTCGGNNWRQEFIEKLGPEFEGKYFNPVVTEWNDAAQAAEEKAKFDATHMLFYLADPKQEGLSLSAYSMVEATMGLYDEPASAGRSVRPPVTCVVVFDNRGIEGHALKTMKQTEKVLRKRFPDAKILSSLDDAISFFKTQN